MGRPGAWFDRSRPDEASGRLLSELTKSGWTSFPVRPAEAGPWESDDTTSGPGREGLRGKGERARMGLRNGRGQGTPEPSRFPIWPRRLIHEDVHRLCGVGP